MMFHWVVLLSCLAHLAIGQTQSQLDRYERLRGTGVVREPVVIRLQPQQQLTQQDYQQALQLQRQRDAAENAARQG